MATNSLLINKVVLSLDPATDTGISIGYKGELINPTHLDFSKHLIKMIKTINGKKVGWTDISFQDRLVFAKIIVDKLIKEIKPDVMVVEKVMMVQYFAGDSKGSCPKPVFNMNSIEWQFGLLNIIRNVASENGITFYEQAISTTSSHFKNNPDYIKVKVEGRKKIDKKSMNWFNKKFGNKFFITKNDNITDSAAQIESFYANGKLKDPIFNENTSKRIKVWKDYINEGENLIKWPNQ